METGLVGDSYTQIVQGLQAGQQIATPSYTGRHEHGTHVRPDPTSHRRRLRRRWRRRRILVRGLAMMTLENITKVYQMDGVEVHALRGVSLRVDEGEFVAIMGASGSGKSTLMNVLGCLDRPTSGRYLLDGTDVSTLSDGDLATIRNRTIGFVFQSFNLLPRASALRNVEMPLIYGGYGREKRQMALAALEHVGMANRVHHRPTQLSGGQQQRVAVARALVTGPGVLLADEPTGNLDSASSKDVMGLIVELHQQGHTIVLITHDPNVAATADRVIHLVDGQVSAEEHRPTVSAPSKAEVRA